MPTPLFRINAFSQDPFGGNPAAICFLDREAHPDWMQAVAAELDLAETAFLLRKGDDFGLRWFTPTVEVPLCGHATLASAHAIWEAGRSDPEATLRFQTKSGLLEARRQGDLIWLDFPALPPSPAAAPPGLIEALGVRPSYVGRGSEMFFLVEVESADAVRALRPDFATLAQVGSGVIVTARADDARSDFVSRFFAPSHGIDEDPVTGAAHCTLGPYWAHKLQRQTVTGYQASARGGIVQVRPRGPRVELGGHAVTVLRGELLA
ncbi:MAG: PhzF family phenazine biosynthesis protein [Myxococcota bacterium]|nr:PhzF family phenazine biosynthesis protein [Myxococcota bacterium]